ncbi:hypothetical protein AM10699_67120 (plasmid) [Acaryochloris marina MBIC10699]|nr:hypothetical protein AM10699_67120 [Acaryochloris marina MBIC10699]
MSRLPEIAQSDRQAYPSDMSDAEWDVLRPLLPPAKGFGRPRTVNLREILNAISYVQRSGCQWEMLPHDLTLTRPSISISKSGIVMGSGRRFTRL